ncbi:hypothetical protein N665_2524s0002 [Sinapis alba]|nr:hypothetical protein N665_2524s0002 [Sinapis alba]
MILLQYWALPTFESIVNALGVSKEVDLDNGRIQVEMDGLEQLCFQTVMEFHGGQETLVKLRYERIFGYCQVCHSLCHDQQICPRRQENQEEKRFRDFVFGETR